MNIKQRLTILAAACLTAFGAYAQEPADTPEEEYEPKYEAMQTDYGFFGTTDAIFSKSETIICTFSLTQHNPQGDKIYPTMLNIWLHADAMTAKSQELIVKQIANAGSKLIDGQFRHHATLVLENNEEVELNFSINNLTEDNTHHTVMLTAPITPSLNTPPSTLNAQHSTLNAQHSTLNATLATKLRRYDIVAISIANTTLNLKLLGFKSAQYLNGICQELMLAGCNTEAFNSPDSREAEDYDVSGFQNSRREKSIDELVFHALGCFPSDIRGMKPATAIQIIRNNTEWVMDDEPDYHELEFTQADGYDFTYHGIRIGAEMCWDDNQQLQGYNYYFKLYSKDKQMVKAAYHRLCDELESLGFPLETCSGDRGDKDPRQGTFNSYHVQTCYYLNVNDQYVIQLQVKQEDN